MTAGSGAGASARWLEAARQVLDRIEATQSEAIAAVAGWCADSIGSGRLVHAFGSGHSRIPVEELFPRYGSYPGFHPMAELSMTFHTQVVGVNGQRQAMFIERTEGLAEVILDNFLLTAGDVLIVSASRERVRSRSRWRCTPAGEECGWQRPPRSSTHASPSPSIPPGAGCSITPTS